jgi:hypothetical protein
MKKYFVIAALLLSVSGAANAQAFIAGIAVENTARFVSFIVRTAVNQLSSADNKGFKEVEDKAAIREAEALYTKEFEVPAPEFPEAK